MANSIFLEKITKINSEIREFNRKLNYFLNFIKSLEAIQEEDDRYFFRQHLSRKLSLIIQDPSQNNKLDPEAKKLVQGVIKDHQDWVQYLKQQYSYLLKKKSFRGFSDLEWIKDDKLIQKNLKKKRNKFLLPILDSLWIIKFKEIDPLKKNPLLLVCPDRGKIAETMDISQALVFKYLKATEKVGIIKKTGLRKNKKSIFSIGYYHSGYKKDIFHLKKAKHAQILRDFNPYATKPMEPEAAERKTPAANE